MSTRFDAMRNVRLLYAFGVAREFTPLLSVWVVYLTDFRHLTLTQVGAMEGLFWAVKLALEIPSGAFADRFGRRTTFLTGIAMECTGTLLFAFAGGYSLLVVSYVIWSAGLAFRSGNDEAYLYDALAADGRGHEYTDRIGLYRALGTASLLAGGLAGGILAQAVNLQIAVLAAVVPFVLATPLMLSMQEPPWREHHSAQLSVSETLRHGLREVWRDHPLRTIVLLEVALMGCAPALTLLSQPFLDAHGVPLALFGVLTIPVHLAGTGAGLMSGRLTRRIGLQTTLTLAVAGGVAGLGVLALIDNVGAYAGLALAIGSMSLAMPAIGAYINDRTDSRVRATVLSVAPMGASLTMAAFSASAGIIGAHSLRIAFGAMSLGILVAAGASLLAWLAAEGRAPTLMPEPEIIEV